MKRLIEISVLGALAVISAASCSKELGDNGKAVNNVPMSILATDETSSPDVRTLLDKENDGQCGVVFTSSDKLFVFGEKEGDIQGVQFSTNDKGRKKSYAFTTKDWPEGYTPIYAITSTLKDAKQVCTSDGKITLQVNNEEQRYAWSGSYATNTTTHVGEVESSQTTLKNVCGLINFCVKNDDITKIVVSGNNGEVLGGWVTVDYSKMASDLTGFYTPEVDGVKKLNLSVAETLDNKEERVTNGCFPTDTSFFISILPGEYTAGLTFKLFNSKGESATRVVSGPLKINRSQIRKFNNPLDYDLVFKAAEMPETLTFSMVKGAWPFVENIVPAANQQPEGDEYTYNYASEDGYAGQFKFRLHDNTSYSTSSSEFIKFVSNDGYIQFPAIPGRVLQSVTLQVRNADGKNFAISETTTGRELADGLVPTTGITTTWYSDGAVKTKPNTAYYFRSLQTSAMYTKIEAVYVKELTPTPIVVPEEFTAVLDFSEAWPFENAVTAKPSQAPASDSYDGETYDFKYSETATLKFQICKGKVNEYVYTKPDATKGTVGCLNFGRIGTTGAYEDNEGFVKLPAVPGRYLKEIKITADVNAHTIYICKSNQKETSGDGVLTSFGTKALADGVASSGELDGEVNTPYYLFRNSSTAEKYVKIEVTYSTKQ